MPDLRRVAAFRHCSAQHLRALRWIVNARKRLTAARGVAADPFLS